MTLQTTEEATMSLFGQIADSPLRTASRVFGAVIISLALLVAISAHMRPTTEPRSSITASSLVSLNIDNQGSFLRGPSSNASGYEYES